MPRPERCPVTLTPQEWAEFLDARKLLEQLRQSLRTVFGKDHPLFLAIDAGLVEVLRGDTWPHRLATVRDTLAFWNGVDESIRRRVSFEPILKYERILEDDGYDD
jgi:hypothetical protein